MNEGFQYADLIVLGAIAVFILLRLRSTLGKQTGFDARESPDLSGEPVVRPINQRIQPAIEPVIDAKQIGGGAKEGLDAIKAADPAFNAAEFLKGATAAFEMVYDAFRKGDNDMLARLLTPELHANFKNEIKKREAGENYHETTLVSARAREISKAELIKDMARITVLFDTGQVTLLRDKDGKIVEGDPSHTVQEEAEWVFERDTRSRNPNWVIIET